MLEKVARSQRESEEIDVIQRPMCLCGGCAGRAILGNQFEMWVERVGRNG